MDNRLIIFSALVLLAVLTKLFFRRAYFFCKPLPLMFILFLAFLKPAQIAPLWLVAISFGLAGDVFLLWEKGFLPGLLSFLLGHIFYIAAFAERGGVYAGPLAVFTAAIISLSAFVYLAQHLVRSRRKVYILPVLLYISVTAILVVQSVKPPVLYSAVLGIFLFALSDFLLAFDKFVRQIWYVQAGVSLTYFTAQWLLAIRFAAV